MDIDKIRHSLSHIMASAVLEMHPDAKLGIGPAISTGFYYDFKFNEEFSDSELKEVEKRMKKLIQKKLDFEQIEMPIDDAIAHYKKEANEFKLELINELKSEGVKVLSFYKTGNFMDLCKGPHVANTGEIPQGIFKLDKLAGAYWKGDETRPMLTRIYGLSFETKDALKDYIAKREEALKRDHRRLGVELGLFSTHDDIGSGLICWHPKGARIRGIIEDYWRSEHRKHGYEILYTPHLGRARLWETSGHLDFFSENMYTPMDVEGSDYFIKPMNCPFHIMMYKNERHSYRTLPIKWAELGTVYRYERSGVLHGLLRVRGFTQDDAHIFCTSEQVEDEILEVLKFSLDMWEAFDFKEIKAYVATRPEKSAGDNERWDKAIGSIKKAMERQGMDYQLDEGGGAFYGPKIDLKVTDALDREWQMTTIQFDFNLPERFDMSYVDHDGKYKRPYMIHRALLGSLERFFGVLVEHYGGAFPVWLSPVQVRLLSVTDRSNDFIQEIYNSFKHNGIRAEIDIRNESVSKKIREGRLSRVPYLIVIGDDEIKEKSLAVRNRDTQEQRKLSPDEFISLIKAEDESRTVKTGI